MFTSTWNSESLAQGSTSNFSFNLKFSLLQDQRSKEIVGPQILYLLFTSGSIPAVPGVALGEVKMLNFGPEDFLHFYICLSP